MDRELVRQAEPVEEILTFDIPDDALERAASAEPNALVPISRMTADGPSSKPFTCANSSGSLATRANRSIVV
jgi:hypothetical protein